VSRVWNSIRESMIRAPCLEFDSVVSEKCAVFGILSENL
jgi:hypothetical protein